MKFWIVLMCLPTSRSGTSCLSPSRLLKTTASNAFSARNCFHFSLDIHKVLKNKYYKILITIDECTRGKHITTDKTLSSKTQRNMIYESVRLYEMIQCFKQVNRIDCGEES